MVNFKIGKCNEKDVNSVCQSPCSSVVQEHPTGLQKVMGSTEFTYFSKYDSLHETSAMVTNMKSRYEVQSIYKSFIL